MPNPLVPAAAALVTVSKIAKKVYGATKRAPHGGKKQLSRQEIEDEYFPKINEQLGKISRITGKPLKELPTDKQVASSIEKQIQKYTQPRSSQKSIEKPK